MTRSRSDQRGVATLVTVMVLFFVMALVAAYANRNLIVEQRVAQSYHALGIASETNHQAIAYMLRLLNSGRINDRCELDSAGAGTLRSRLLVFNADGTIGVPAASLSAQRETEYAIACDRVRPNGEWQCKCASDYRPALQADDGAARESFRGRIKPFTGSGNAGRVGLSVVACAAASGLCDAFGAEGESVVTTRVQSLLLLRALKTPPSSPLVATGRVNLGNGMAAVHNDAAYGGVAVQAGRAVIDNHQTAQGPNGSPSNASVVSDDAQLAGADADGFFRLFFGMTMDEYQAHPALRKLECDDGCAVALQRMVAAGAQLILHTGDLRLDGAGELVGSATQPVVLIVRGRLTLTGPLHLHGVVFASGDLTWSNTSGNPSIVQGAVLVAGDVQGTQGATALFDGAVINTLKLQAGSFIQLPGGSHWEKTW